MKRILASLALVAALLFTPFSPAFDQVASPPVAEAASCSWYNHGNGGVAYCEAGAYATSNWRIFRSHVVCVGWITQSVAGPWKQLRYGGTSYAACPSGTSVYKTEIRLAQ